MEGWARSFGPYRLYTGRRLLLHGERPVRLGSRAMDLLIALTERPGEVIAKEELIARAWPGTFVEEANLRVHVGALRKALADDVGEARFITNVPGRGYCFVAPIGDGNAPAAPFAVPPAGVRPKTVAVAPSLPFPMTRLIGRDDVVEEIIALTRGRRLVTIVGPGGMGKTTVALAVAQRVAAERRDGALFVDLAPVGDPRAVPGVLAASLGLTDRSDDRMDKLAAVLRERDTLLLLDNCEHVIDAAAELVEALLARAPGAAILATSREPLRVAGEWVRRLQPLGVPPTDSVLAADALAHSAVQLFVERASSCLGGYALSDADAPAVAEICRRLDGIALAIELAAGHLDTVGVCGLAASLGDSFRMLTRGRRTALPRHQTLRAALDWSYRTLSPAGQRLLRRLAVFNGGFTLDAALRVTAGDELSGWDVEDGIADLVAKSLIAADTRDPELRYRLLETSRTYAREKLREAREEETFQRRHAEYFRGVFEQAEAEWETKPTRDWLADHGRHIDNLRAALDWAFSPAGDPAVGVALTVAAVPIWFALLLADECHDRVRRALEVLESWPGDAGVERSRMRLYAAFGWPQMRAIAGWPHGAAAWRRTLEIAEAVGDADYQARALWALWVDRINAGKPREALALAGRFRDLAAVDGGDPADPRIAERMRARALYFMGQPAAAHASIGRMLDGYVAPVNRSHTVRFQYEQRATARITMAHALWMLGFQDRAAWEVEDTLAALEVDRHDLTLAHVLSDAACAIALLNGDLDRAERYIARLHHVTRIHSLDVWNTYADAFAGELAILRGETAAGVARLSEALDRLRATGFVLYQTAHTAALALGLIKVGRGDEALAMVDAALMRCERDSEGWYVPELHRVRGEILAAGGEISRAEAAFHDALTVARARGAKGWEERAVASLVRLQRASGGHRETAAMARDTLDGRAGTGGA